MGPDLRAEGSARCLATTWFPGMTTKNQAAERGPQLELGTARAALLLRQHHQAISLGEKNQPSLSTCCLVAHGAGGGAERSRLLRSPHSEDLQSRYQSSGQERPMGGWKH